MASFQNGSRIMISWPPDNSQINAGSPERFGYEWETYADILPNHEIQFQKWTPFLKREDWIGKTFLDVGCGMGRNSYWPMVYGAAGGLAIDVNERSLSAAQKNLKPFPEVELRFQSSYDIPEKDRFDIVFSIGVIHHLQHPVLALQKMVAATKPGGRVLIWVYGFENNQWIVKYFDPIRKAVFSILPITWVHRLSIFPTVILWILLRCGLDHLEYHRFLRSLTFPHLRSIVFDQLLPTIARYYRREEVLSLMESAGLVDVKINSVNDISWSVIGHKQK